MTLILNLTQHNATADQLAAGVVDLPADQQQELKQLLTFDTLPDVAELKDRAMKVAQLALRFFEAQKVETGNRRNKPVAMIGGAPFFMATLEWALLGDYIKPVYAFSQRVCIETQTESGVIKTSEFQHMGFVDGGWAIYD